MFTEAMRTLERYATYRHLLLLFLAILLPVVIGVHSVFSDTALELDLVGQIRKAREELELSQRLDMSEELDLVPGEPPSVDCPPGKSSVRKITPVRVQPVTRFPTQRIQVYQKPVIRVCQKPKVIHSKPQTTYVSNQPVYQSPTASGTLPVKVTYKTDKPDKPSTGTGDKIRQKELQRIQRALDEAQEQLADAEIGAKVNQEEKEAAEDAVESAQQRLNNWTPPENWQPEVLNPLYENYERDQRALRERSGLQNNLTNARNAFDRAKKASDQSWGGVRDLKDRVRYLETQKRMWSQAK